MVICGYCGKEAKLLKSSESVYHGTNYGPVWVCWDCNAWVGALSEKHDFRPKGSLANKDLRMKRMRAHKFFDTLWKVKARRDKIPTDVCRTLGYQWLAQQMGLTEEECHIGMFSEERCDRVVEICMPYIPTYRGDSA
jgi:hypothetical protein